jgi:hypothetical protein
MSMKNPNDNNGNRTSYFPACKAVPNQLHQRVQPPSSAPFQGVLHIIKKNYTLRGNSRRKQTGGLNPLNLKLIKKIIFI